MKTVDLVGRRFGMLTVCGDSGQRKDACILWRCICDCGKEALFIRRDLISGVAVNCGCQPKEAASKGHAEDLTGQQFGSLTVLRRVENDKNNKVQWLCRCECGQECVVKSAALKTGHKSSCGCKRYAISYNGKDLTGQRFGRFTVLYRSEQDKKGQGVTWHCRCDCGKEVDVPACSLSRGLIRSCGCLNYEEMLRMHDHMHYQDNTCLEMLERSQRNWAENKAGFRGLFLTKKGKYRAMITFRKTHYMLGYYNTFDAAVQARLYAEQSLHAGYIEAFRLYQERQAADPAWAEDNPFYYDVQRVNGEFYVSTNGTAMKQEMRDPT